MESHTDLDTSCSHMPRCCVSLPRSVTRRRRAAWFVFATGTRRIGRSQAKAWGARVCSSTASAPEREGWQRHRRRFLSLPQAHFIPQRSSTSGKRGCKSVSTLLFLARALLLPSPRGHLLLLCLLLSLLRVAKTTNVRGNLAVTGNNLSCAQRCRGRVRHFAHPQSVRVLWAPRCSGCLV